MMNSLNQHLIRLDCLINLDEELFKIAEVEIKGGSGTTTREKVILVMKVAWLDKIKIWDALEGKPCQINNLFDWGNTFFRSKEWNLKRKITHI